MLQRNRLSPSSIGDIGCGSGDVICELARRLPPHTVLTGYDISPQAIALASVHRVDDDRVRFSLQDPLADSGLHFDLIIVLDVFEHVDDYMGFLTRLRTLSTHTIFHIPLDMSVSSVLRTTPLIHARQQVGHLHYFSQETALATLQDTGYRIVDQFITTGGVELPNRSLTSRIAAVPRALMYRLNPPLAARLLGGFSLMVLAE